MAEDVSALLGLSWAANDMIFYARVEGVYQVPATGGIPELIIDAADGESIYGPRLLPDGDSVLFSVGTPGDWDSAQVVVQSLSRDERIVLVDGGNDARYLPTGHLVYALRDDLLVERFDLDTLTTSGGPVPVLQGVWRAAATAAANYGVSNEGALVYVAGGEVAETRALVWMDRDGSEDRLTGLEPGDYKDPRVSPDGQRLAFTATDDGNTDVWTYDLERGIPTRLTFHEARDEYPLWTPDGRRIVFWSERDGGGLFLRNADGTGQPERLGELIGSQTQIPTSFLADGSELIFFTQGGGALSDLYALSLNGEVAPRMIIASDFDEDGADVSPNGRWIAYTTDASGEDQVYVQPYPNVDDGKWQVSPDGGENVLWGPDGRELFYRRRGALMVVGIEDEPNFSFERPVELFSSGFPAAYGFDLSPDGQRFVRLDQGGTMGAAAQIIVVQNWFEEVNRLAPPSE